jgi:arylsulfatase
MASQPFSRRRFLQAAAAVSARAASPQARPNIVFLMSDSHRFDALGCAGNDIVQTPNLDRLARQGVRFSHTYCQGPLCQPSRASLITGQYLHQHGQTWNDINMNPEWPTLMKSLQQAGYFTAKVGKAHFAGKGSAFPSKDLREIEPWCRRFGLDWLLEEYDRGVHLGAGIITPFTEYLKSRNLLQTYIAETPHVGPQSDTRGMYTGKISKLPQEHTQTSFLADRTVEWLRSYKQDKPFFLWVSFIDPHPPVVDDARWAARYQDASIPAKPATMPDLPDNAWGRYLRTWLQFMRTENFTPEGAAEMARHYYGMISLIDQRIGDIVRAIQDRGWDKNTWIFYTSDHGEMLGEHKLVFKNVFYKGSVRVPNIVRPPGGMPGRTVDQLVESIDITATMADIAGARMPAAKGRSLAPLVKGSGAGREVAYSELAGHQNKGNFLVMAATPRYRYLYDKENNLPCELYDLEKDPDELHNLVEEPGHVGIRKDMHKDYVLPFLDS